jgi:MFS family permease
VATTGDETLADVATTAQDTLADEQRRRIPAAVAAITAGILTLAGGALTAVVFSDRPVVYVLDAMQEQLSPNPPQPGLKARQVLWADENALKLVLLGVLLALAAAAIGLALSHLYRSVKARRPELPRAVLVAGVTGAALLAASSLLQAVGSAVSASSFADSANQTAAAARDALRPPAVLAAGIMQIVGIFAIAIAFVLLSLNGMRVGLLTRFMGVLGIIVGVLFVVPLGSASLPLVQALWFVALGVLFLGRWPGGMPPAWVTGEARPWPSQQELREARAERQAASGADERPRRGVRRERAEPPETPAPELPERRPHPSSKKRKRKRR